jgi:N6-adenosine-specific RNA methylase IME4
MSEILESNQAEIVSHADMVEANQAYGALAEGFYLAGFTFERAMTRVLGLLKTGGWMKVGAGFDDVNAFVRGLPLDQFKIVAEQRREFVQRVKELQLEVSNRAIADALGVHHDAVDRDARGGNPPGDRQNVEENRETGGGNPPGAYDGRRDARLIVQRDTREERREEKLQSMGEAARLSGRFSVIYADPPWTDEFGPSAGQVELHYPVMSDDEIEALDVESIAADDSILYMWTLPHMMPTALEIMEAWGFDYRTQMVWAKDRAGLGQYARNQHETLLIGRQGAFPPPPERLRVGSVIHAPVGEHSEKPEVFLRHIERWYPDVPKIELFRRGPARPGWSAWGNEVGPELAAE